MNQIFVFNKNEVLQAVLSNDGAACPFWDAVHTEEINGENSFVFTIPGNHPDAGYVVEGGLIAFRDLDGDFQLFEIRRVTEKHEQELLKEVFCEHAVFELLDEHITWFSASNMTPLQSLQTALNGTRWQAGTVELTGAQNVRFRLTSAMAAVMQVAKQFKGELRYRVTISNQTITGRYVDLLSRRGGDFGKRFEYGKDMGSVERTVDTSQLYTAVYAYGKSERQPNGDYMRKRIAEVVWSKASGNPADKPYGQEWIGDDTAKSLWGRAGGTRHRFGMFGDDEETDPKILIQKAWDYLQTVKDPLISYRMNVADLERLTGYEHEKVRLGDTVRVIDRAFNPPLQVSARVIQIKRDLVMPENTEITLGNFLPSLYNNAERIADLEKKQGLYQGGLDQPVDNLNALIRENNNMVNDHSFEMVQTIGSADAYQTFAVNTSIVGYGNYYWWKFAGSNPRVLSTYNTDAPQMAAFDFQAAVVSPNSRPYQYLRLDKAAGIGGPYTLSAYVAAYDGTTADASGTIEMWACNNLGGRIQKIGSTSFTVLASEKWKWKRYSVVVTTSLPSNTSLLEITITAASGTFLVDGVQCVPLVNPTAYDPESSLWRALRGMSGYFLFNPLIIGGASVEGNQVWHDGNAKCQAMNATLLNGWTNYGSGYGLARYWKNRDTVQISGLVNMPANGVGTTIFQLPVGYRPAYQLIFPVNQNSSHARVDVKPDGSVVFVSGANGGWVALDGISFVVEQ
ncbi:phage tail spike protein [Effusibacillus pohliae]|uniref:phage tail spike protein n=1 Tax=Effusibacillus pohliae TaxID=232270 RepID=UPI00035E357F|nr:phage tail protein [Effusibacillus pohliae]